VTPAVSDGRLGGAVVARPGGIDLKGSVDRITGKSILPPRSSDNHGVGAEQSCADIDVQPTLQNLFSTAARVRFH
jgi:hypothetical protein